MVEELSKSGLHAEGVAYKSLEIGAILTLCHNPSNLMSFRGNCVD